MTHSCPLPSQLARLVRPLAMARPGLVVPALALVLALALAAPALAQNELEGILSGVGEASAVDEEAENAAAMANQKEGEGTIIGQVLDGETGAALSGVTIILEWPGGTDQEVAQTDFGGSFEFASVPPGIYSINFVKSGYRTATLKDFEVQAGLVSRADFPLPKLATTTSDEILNLDALVIDQVMVSDMMNQLELRLDSDSLINVMGAEDFSKFAAADVAEALTRVSGVNVVGGQFAVIRGLEDRYSSTTFNGAIVPSPDPNKQSPQLDLFPSKIVSNLQVKKTYLPDLAGNSSGGSMDVVTRAFADELEIKLEAAIRINDNAVERFLRLDPGNPVGKEKCCLDAIGGEFAGSISGTTEAWKRALRYKAVVHWKSDYKTRVGYEEKRGPYWGVRNTLEPSNLNGTGDLPFGELSVSQGRFEYTRSDRDLQTVAFGAIGMDIDREGNHAVDLSLFYIDKSRDTVEEFANGWFPDLDYSPWVEAGPGAVDVLDVPGFFDGVSNDNWMWSTERLIDQPRFRGPLWFDSMQFSRSVATERSLLIAQLNGDHLIEAIEGLEVNWAANFSRATQSDRSYAMRYWYEQCGVGQNGFPCPEGVTTGPLPDPNLGPVTPERLGFGSFMTTTRNIGGWVFSDLEVEELSGFGRLDVTYERDLTDFMLGNFSTGGWYESADRSVATEFLTTPVVNGDAVPPAADLPVTALWLGRLAFQRDIQRDFGDPRPEEESFYLSSSDAVIDQEREVGAWYGGAKLTFFEDLDLLGGVRLESLRISTTGVPFVRPITSSIDPVGVDNLNPDGTRKIFPSKYLFLDRIDDPRVGPDPPRRRENIRAPLAEGATFNHEILGIPVVEPDFSDTACDPLPTFQNPNPTPRGCWNLNDQQLVDVLSDTGIDQLNVLPSAGLTYRLTDWATLRAAYSETPARPSFRELGYYPSVEPGNDEVFVGNPFLEVSDVRSVDGRIEFNWNEEGDLIAFSGFYKTIDMPIESILLFNEGQAFDEPEQARTFLNNPNQAKLWGLEVELQQNLSIVNRIPILPDWEFLQYWSIGANGTYIDAEVRQPQSQIDSYYRLYGVNINDVDDVLFTEYATTRRLFGQPEWIANANITFDHPDWGTRMTLAFFAISDVLDALGTVEQEGTAIVGASIDRYVDSYHQLDLIMKQDLPGGFTVKFRVKNLTDSLRGRFYDPNLTTEKIFERQVRRGRDYKLTIAWTF